MEQNIPEVDLDYFFDRLFPRTLPRADRDDKTDVAIKKRHVYIVGREDRGKDNAAKWIENEGTYRYGTKRVAVDMADAEDFGAMLRTKWQQHRDIQFKIINDGTNVGIPNQDVHSFFTIRHEMREGTGLRSGLIITLMLCHRLHNTPAAMHDAGYDSLLLLSSPAKGSWDWQFLRNLVGEAALEELSKHDEEAQLDPTNEKKGYVLVIYEDRFLGITKIPKSHWTTKIREIKPHHEPEQLFEERKTKTQKTPRKEKTLFFSVILLPWLYLAAWLYFGLYLNYRNIMLESFYSWTWLGLYALLSAAYVIARVSRFRKRRQKP